MRTKSIIMALITLAVGFLLGMLTSSQLRNQRLKPVRVFSSEERFKEGMYNAIQPTEEQKARIDKILDKYSILNSEAGDAFRKEFEVRMEKFRSEIDANLTPEQIVRLKELDEQRKRMTTSRRRGGRNRDNFNRFDNERCDSVKSNQH